RAPYLCRDTGYRQGRVQNQKLARPAAEGVVSLRHGFLGEAPLPHVVHYPDDLVPGAVVATMREHPSKRVLIRPEEAGHALINHARIDAVGLIRWWLAVALIERAEAHIERLGRLNVSGCWYPPLQQSHSHRAEVLRRHGMTLH